MDEEEAVLPSSSATSERGIIKKKNKSYKINIWKRDGQRKRKRGSLLQIQAGRKRYTTEKCVVYGFSLSSNPEVIRVSNIRFL